MLLLTAWFCPAAAVAAPQPSPFDLECAPEAWPRISWYGESNRYYDLHTSADLVVWEPVDGYPKAGTGNLMAELRSPAGREFYRMAWAADLDSFLLPEVAAYKANTGITSAAAHEINQFLRHLRGAGVEPALFWVGGYRYNSISGSTVRAVIGGNGTLVGTLGPRGERFETFTKFQALRFPNPLKDQSQSRVGFFAGAAPSSAPGVGVLIGGGSNSNGPRLATNEGAGNFFVFDSAGTPLPHAGYGGYVNPGTFMPYVGGAYDGKFSVLCGLGKSSGSREHPLQFTPMPSGTFPNGTFVNNQPYIEIGAPYFSGNLHFAVVTAADLTDNKTAYALTSIPRRCGWGPYGNKTAVVYLGDSISIGYNAHVWNSDGMSPPHKAGGQWNRNSLGLVANATGEGNDAQIEYYEKGARYALDTRTWDHLFYICASGGHYRHEDHVTQNPLSQEAKDTVDAWVNEYHTRIAIPAAERGATVVQMTYIYGCPQNNNPPKAPDYYRTFTDYFTAKQREVALSAGFAIFDAYNIPQLHAPLPAFYADMIHPNAAGYRLIAQEFAASVSNPASTAPRSVARPSISGTAKAGRTLTATKGSWTFNPVTYTYQWMRNATDIPGATSSAYLIQSADAGANLSCRVTATNTGGSAERTSAHSSTVFP